MNLSNVFEAVAHKELTAVDLPNLASNQHELNGVAALRLFFGTGEPTRSEISWHYFADDVEPTEQDGDFTFYDARAKTAERTGRTEWRFYYQGDFLRQANVGDTLIFARTKTGQLFGLVFQSDSSWLRSARSLFGIDKSGTHFDEIPRGTLDAQELEFIRGQILAELNLEVTLPVIETDEQIMVDRFGRQFPTTREMSEFARTQVETDVRRPDETIVRWLEREEQLFRALEKVIIGERLKDGFVTVDIFIEYSLSVQNRRKSRMGFALQNHLTELFTQHGLRFTAQPRTEASSRPDFIFPGELEYHDSTFAQSLLVMLGVKSTSKDRWRQVLTEADRIPEKHLCTLEPSISTKQTDEMRRQHLTLVLPERLHETYSEPQRAALLSVEDFIEYVRKKQR